MFQTVFWFIIKTSQCCSLFYDWFYSLGHYSFIYFIAFNVLPLFYSAEFNNDKQKSAK